MNISKQSRNYDMGCFKDRVGSRVFLVGMEIDEAIQKSLKEPNDPYVRKEISVMYKVLRDNQNYLKEVGVIIEDVIYYCEFEERTDECPYYYFHFYVMMPKDGNRPHKLAKASGIEGGWGFGLEEVEKLPSRIGSLSK
jgi:hypothetical protein